MQQLTPEQLEDLAYIAMDYVNLIRGLENTQYAQAPEQQRRVELAETLVLSIHCGKVELKYECPDESGLIV